MDRIFITKADYDEILTEIERLHNIIDQQGHALLEVKTAKHSMIQPLYEKLYQAARSEDQEAVKAAIQEIDRANIRIDTMISDVRNTFALLNSYHVR